MNKRERKFHILKNKLDNKYHEWLSYLEIGTIIIATATISASMFFLNKNDMESLINTAVFGVMLFFLFTVYFKGKLKEIKQKIDKLT